MRSPPHIEDHGRHAEHAERLGLVDDAVVLGTRGAVHISLEFHGRAAKAFDHGADFGEFVEFQLVIPEAPEYRLVVGPEKAMALSEQHAGAGIEGVIDAPRPLEGQPLCVRKTPRVHVEVANLAPEVRRALFHGAHEFGDPQRIGQPFELDALLLLQREQRRVGDEGVGALVVGVDSDPRLCHRTPPSAPFSFPCEMRGRVVSSAMAVKRAIKSRQ